MAPRKKSIENDGAAVVAVTPSSAPPLPASKLPVPMRFPLYCIVSLSLSALLHTFISDANGYELSSVSKTYEENWQVAATLIWRVIELAIGWFGEYDDLDLASLTFLTHTPYLFLLYTFYDISYMTVASALFISVTSTALPARLLRPRSVSHNPLAPKSKIPNRAIIHDLPVIASTSFFGSALYSVFIWTCLHLGLPLFLTQHFDEIRNLALAHSISLQHLFALFVPLGYAAREFILTPSLAGGVGVTSKSTEKSSLVISKPFNPATATLRETFEYNVFGPQQRNRVVMRRVISLAGLVTASTVVHCTRALKGADLLGSAGYASVWAIASVLAGIAFQWVGDVDQ